MRRDRGCCFCSAIPTPDFIPFLADVVTDSPTSNVAMSNVALDMISVPLHQVMRSLCPIATILLSRLIYKRTYSTRTYLTMIPLISGVALATMGDYYCSYAGFLTSALGVALASIKTVATNRILTGPLKLSSLELLLRMGPLATIQCLFVAWMSGEVDAVRVVLLEASTGMGLLVNGVSPITCLVIMKIFRDHVTC